MLAELLFELSSGERLKLLSEISKKKQRASQLALEISATIQEASRQVTRLHDAGLIERDSDGYYGLTAFGGVVLKLMPSLDFLSKNRGYFLSHDISTIPEVFLERIGELSEYEFGQMAGSVLRHSEQVLSESKEYVWLLADHPLLSGSTIAQALKDRNVPVRILVPEVNSSDRIEFEKARGVLGERLEVRFAADINVAIAMNEERAGVAFPDLTGRVDYNRGFRGTSERFRSWCSDLFSFHWKKSMRAL